MISTSKFREFVDQGMVAHVRVVPVPFERAWCIDAVVRTPLEPGSTTDTLADPHAPAGALRTFPSIDAAARFLHSVNVNAFTVDTADSPSPLNLGTDVVRILETTQRLWADEKDVVGSAA